MSSRSSIVSNTTGTSSVRSNTLSFLRRKTRKYTKKPLQTPDAAGSLKIEPKSWKIEPLPVEIHQKEGLDFTAFSPTAEFVAVAAGCKLKIISWDQKYNPPWDICWGATVLRECMTTVERIVAIALSTTLVAVAAKRGFEVYELHTPGPRDLTTLLEKEPVIQVMDVSDLRAIAVSSETPETKGRICVGTGDGKLLIWDIRCGNDGHYTLMPQPPHELPSKGHDKEKLDIPSAVTFNHDGSQICVGSANRRIYIYKLEEGLWSRDWNHNLGGNFGDDGTLGLIRFTTMAFLDEDQIAFTASSTFAAGCPAVINMKNKHTALDHKILEAQSLAVSPSKTSLVFVDNRKRGGKHRVMLVRGSPQGRFESGFAVTTHVGDLKHGAALAFTQPDGNTKGPEPFLAMDRMGSIHLFSCNDTAPVNEMGSDNLA